MVITFNDHVADTPAGNPLAPDTPLFNIPVAPVVACVIELRDVLIHNVVVVPALAELVAVTMIVPVAFTLPHPPVNRIL